MYPKNHIVIIGGGFGGVACAKACAKANARRPDVEITLITPHPYHEFTPALYAGATDIGAMHCTGHGKAGSPRWSHGLPRVGSDKAGEAGHAVHQALCLPHEKIFAGTKVRLLYGWVKRIDRQAQSITMPHHTPVHYSYLVLALGSETDYYDIPGLAVHAYVVKTVKDSLYLRHRLEQVLKKRDGSIIIGGGGFTGAEIAAELGWTIRKKNTAIKVTLIEGDTPVLSLLGAQVSGIARARLSRVGVVLRKKTRIAAVMRHEAHGVRVRLSTDEVLDGDLLVWTGGVRGVKLYSQIFPLYVGAQGRVSIEETLMVVGEKNIFAIGDGAYLTTNAHTQGLPMQAWMAIAEGVHAAENISALIGGRALVPFHPPSLPYVVPLGGKYGIVVYHGKVWRGFYPWMLKQLIELRYYMQLLGRWQGMGLWMKEEKMCIHE